MHARRGVCVEGVARTQDTRRRARARASPRRLQSRTHGDSKHARTVTPRTHALLLAHAAKDALLEIRAYERRQLPKTAQKERHEPVEKSRSSHAQRADKLRGTGYVRNC
eukprot:6187413-Pleurochrysis_carterae.AAC.1